MHANMRAVRFAKTYLETTVDRFTIKYEAKHVAEWGTRIDAQTTW
jgi:hypothetical protein